MNFTENIIMIIVLGCLLCGYVLKKWVKDVENKYIPTILSILGALMNCMVSGISLENIIYGALSGLASTGLHQAFTRFIEKDRDFDV
ncbi:phage holin family protein [Tannockella kyphosi]|uniref:phage holin family protein n=1 Tax=Tannockella kyphosi TaxID=2899121 RepID=UPI00201261CC|nr:phage holin family protein [Tannockella kyphosi]